MRKWSVPSRKSCHDAAADTPVALSRNSADSANAPVLPVLVEVASRPPPLPDPVVRYADRARAAP